ncbi:WD40 repeat-like protein, partial [Jaminaea rosea]
LPMASHVVLSSHTKPLSALSIDSSGARLVTGGYDYDVRLWDFGGMTSSFEPFKRLDEPFGSYWLHDVAWSPRNDAFLAASGTSQARLYDREGNHTGTCAKGDPYLRDMKQTKGHVAHVSSCSWIDDETFVTASADSTIRIWNIETCRLGQKTVINVRSKDRGGRTNVTAHAISNTNQGRRTLAAACADGAIHIWTMATSSSASSYSKPNATVLQAHKPGTETSRIVFSRDGRTLATRGGPGDDTVKLWDLRNFKEPIAQRSGLPNDYAQTDIIFSPDEATLLTGVAGRGIEVLSRKDLSTVQTIDVPASGSSKPSVVRLAWHPRINQIFATLSTGACLVYYSPQSSIRGALLALPKTSRTRARSPSDIMDVGPIITPGSSSATERGQGISQAAKRRRMDRAAASDPRAPQRPIEGVGKGGRIGTAVNPNRAQAEDVAMLREDPREALLKYAGGEKKFTAAWQTNQPKTLYEEERKE